MKKCLVLHGSPRRGNTYKATMLVVDELAKQPDWDFEHIRIKDLNLPFCLGCFTCILNDENKCPHTGILSPILRKIWMLTL